jgi:hypothetical protein
MLFRQFFGSASSTYTYMLASRVRAEAVIIDPVKEQLEQYLKVIEQLVHANLPNPRMMDVAIPANLARGEPSALPAWQG